jgi:hypothetical protein
MVWALIGGGVLIEPSPGSTASVYFGPVGSSLRESEAEGLA